MDTGEDDRGWQQVLRGRGVGSGRGEDDASQAPSSTGHAGRVPGAAVPTHVPPGAPQPCTETQALCLGSGHPPVGEVGRPRQVGGLRVEAGMGPSAWEQGAHLVAALLWRTGFRLVCAGWDVHLWVKEAAASGAG